MKLAIAIVASGSGSNANRIMQLAAQQCLDVDVRGVFSNNPDAGALAHAQRAGVARWSLRHQDVASREAFDARLHDAIVASGAQYVVLAGYMRLLSASFIQAFAGRIVNIHPAILPSFPGVQGIDDALAYSVRLAGCTVHFVTEEMDSGPIIIQAAVPVLAGMSRTTLASRIHAMEHKIYPQALQWLAEERLVLTGRAVVVLPASDGREAVSVGAEVHGEQGAWLCSPGLEAPFMTV